MRPWVLLLLLGAASRAQLYQDSGIDESDGDDLLFGEDEVPPPSAGGDSESSAHFVTELNPFTFNHHVLRANTDTVWVIKFYAPSCPHCVRMAPDFKRASVEVEREAATTLAAARRSGSASAAASARLRVRVGAMDGSLYSGFTQAYQVEGFPTVLGFLPSKLREPKNAKSPHPVPMAGLGGWESIVAFGKKLHKGAAARRAALQGAAADPRKSKLCPQLLPEELPAFCRGRHISSGGATVAVLYLGATEDPEPPEWLTYLAIKLKKGAAKRAAFAYVPAPASHALAAAFGVGDQLPAVVATAEVEEEVEEEEDEKQDAGEEEGREEGATAVESSRVQRSRLPPLRTLRFVRFSKALVCGSAAANSADNDADCERTRRESLFEFADAFARHPDVFTTEPMPTLPRPQGGSSANSALLREEGIVKLTEEVEEDRCLGLHRGKQKKKPMCVLLFTTETGISSSSSSGGGAGAGGAGGGDGTAAAGAPKKRKRHKMSKEHALLLGLSVKYATDPFVFSYLRLDEQPEFAEAFGVVAPTVGEGAADPVLVVLKTGKRNRFARLQLGDAAPARPAAAEAFLEGVLGGNARFKRLTELPHLIEELLDELPREAEAPTE